MATETTSLSTMSEHDWRILSSRWSRGADWNIEKVPGGRWALMSFPKDVFAGILFRTKTAAWEAGSRLICDEARHRVSI